MNWRHFRAFVWLRWRLMVNHWRRAGKFSAAIMIVLSVGALVSVIPAFLGTFALATYLIPKATPARLMYAWDGLIFFFLLFWVIGLITELQRNDPLSLSKFLHLPVSVEGAFLINFLSSLMKLSLLCFGPVMLAYALALVYVQGWRQLPTLLGLAAFFLMIAAPTYQFQGWLASLVNNPRRRRTVIMATTMTFVLIFQAPNLINLYISQRGQGQAPRLARHTEDLKKNAAALQAGEIGPEEAQKRLVQLGKDYLAETERESREETAQLQGMIRLGNQVVPLGWLPMGVMASAEGRVVPALLGMVGMVLIGSFSLRHAFRATIGQYQGQSSSRKKAAPAARVAAVGDRPRVGLLEARLPGISEPVSAIILGSLQSLLRSPEAKLSLLTPIILGGVFGTMMFKGRDSIAEPFRPLLGVAAIAFTLFGLLQVMGNQFGVDRDGFRTFVLCNIPRRDILLGKNLAYAPIALVLSAILVVGVLVICPLRLDHALSMIPQFVSMFLLFCATANIFSIYAPVYVASGTLKAANPKLSTVMLQLAMFFVLFPICQGVSLFPLGIESALNIAGWSSRVPVCLILAVLESVGIGFLYRASLGWLGGQLEAREQKILEVVTNRGL